jgi:holo-[acyl-carrier protein] synthase
MILGLGLDLCRVTRISEAHARFGTRFLTRCYTPAEAAAALARPQPARALAMRFAAKEAFAKAAGLGFKGLAPAEIEVTHDALGKPSLALHGRALQWAQTHGLVSSHLSLTDEGDYAAAVVVLEK